jgi:hypothetical protein
MTTNIPLGGRGSFLGDLGRSPLLDHPPPRTFLGDLARSGLLAPPPPVSLASALMAARPTAASCKGCIATHLQQVEDSFPLACTGLGEPRRSLDYS